MTEKRDIVYRYGQEGLEDLQRKLMEMSAAAQDAAKKIGDGGRSSTSAMKALDQGVKEAKGAVEDLASRAGPLGNVLMRLGPAGMAAAAAIAATGGSVVKAVTAAAEAERAMVKIEAVLHASGGAAGKTAREIDELTKSLARQTLATEEGAKQAATQLLAFDKVAGDVFDRTLGLAQDLAAAGFGSLSSNAVALGKALQDPAEGLDGLARLGIKLTETQREQIAVMAEMGQGLEAQGLLLDTIKSKVGGTGEAERDTLTGAWHGLSEASGEYFENLGNWLGLLPAIKSGIEGITSAVNAQAAAMTPEGELAILEGQQWDAERAGHQVFNNVNTARLRQLRLEVEMARVVDEVNRHLQEKEALRLQTVEAHGQAIAKTTAARLADLKVAMDAAEKEMKEQAALNERIAAQKSEMYRQIKVDREKDYQHALETVRKIQADIEKQIEPSAGGLGQSIMGIGTPADIQRVIDGWEEAAREIATINDQMTRNMFDAQRDLWRDMLNGQVRDYEDFAKRLGDVGAEWAANHLAKQGQEYLLKQLGQSGMNSLAAGFAGYNFGSSIGGARSGPGNEIGGLIGGAAGASFGPIGTFVGSAIGSMLGGQFGARPSDQSEGVTRELYTGRRWENDLGAGKDSPENRSAVNALDDAIMLFRETLRGFSLKDTASSYMLEVGAGNSLAPYRASVGGGAVQSFDTREEAFQYVAQQLVDSLSEVPAKLQEMVDNFDPTNIEAFFNSIEQFQAFEGTLAGVRSEILKLTDPQAWDTKQIEDWYKAVREQALGFGADVASLSQIDQLRDLRLGQVNARYAPDPSPTANSSLMQDVRDEAARYADAQKFELDKLDAWRTEMMAAAAGNAQDVLTVESVYGKRRADIVKRYAVETETALTEAQQRYIDLMRESIAAQEDAVRSQLDTYRGLQNFMRQSSDSYRSALLEMSLNPSMALPGARLATLADEFNSLRPRALTGDQQAIDELREIGLKYADVAQEFFGSSSDFVEIQARVRDTFEDVAALTGRQAGMAERQLTVLEQQLNELRRISMNPGAVGVPGAAGGQPFTTKLEDFFMINDAWSKSGSPGPGTVANQVFEQGVMRLIDNSGPELIPYLRNMLQHHVQLLGDPVQGGISSRYSEAILLQLKDIATVSKGGVVENIKINDILATLNGTMTNLRNAIQDVLARTAA